MVQASSHEEIEMISKKWGEGWYEYRNVSDGEVLGKAMISLYIRRETAAGYSRKPFKVQYFPNMFTMKLTFGVCYLDHNGVSRRGLRHPDDLGQVVHIARDTSIFDDDV